jgi:hypothetical protein
VPSLKALIPWGVAAFSLINHELCIYLLLSPSVRLCNIRGEIRSAHKLSVGKPQVTTPHESLKLTRIYEDNIRMDIKYRACEYEIY